jgi:hypothetical protein
MADQTIEQYRKQVGAAIDRWWKKVEQANKGIQWINDQIASTEEKLECATELGEKKYKAEIENLKEERTKLVASIRDAGDSLRLDLMMIRLPERTKSNEKEFLKLPGFIGDLVEKKGVPLGKTGLVLTPDVDFDFKAGKLKKFGIELKLEW